ncbi:MAG: DUF5106 domain-containing protein [Bacteroidales bacterium]|nr:DUF5106 domain-containing protein [Bacteroidales bacterium]
MRRTIITALLLCTAFGVGAQSYSFTFRLEGVDDSMLYIGRHYRDDVTLIDSTRRGADGSYTFKGNRTWKRGIYALVRQDRTKQIGDFAIDESRKFTIISDAKFTPSSVTVKGCLSNQQMFNYMNTVQEARKEADKIRERKKDPAQKAQAEADEKALIERMEQYEATTRHPKKPMVFFDLVNACENATVPDSVENKPYYYRHHYWDKLFSNDNRVQKSELLYSPQLFNKLNYFFFGILYHSDSDTICMELDRLMQRLGGDTAMQRYVLDFIAPKYFRSTKNIGWDAVWCHIAKNYYLNGRCPWATEGTLHNMRYNYDRIKQSLIGAPGQELWMLDTTQIDSPEHWFSSHRFPEKYVILWFWDPDCHHCQEQSAELKVLYDSLMNAPDRRFEVYAIGYESDVDKWKKYVREHEFHFVNVGGPHVNIDYQEAYNVHGAPTMIILNEKRDIIMNKVLPIKQLLPFLDEYEKNGHH